MAESKLAESRLAESKFAIKDGYHLLNVLGKGSFGQVVKAIDPNGGLVAVKMIELETDCSIPDILNEITLLRAVSSPYITALTDVKVNETTLWLCMEYCGGGSCYDLLKSVGPLPEDAAAYVLKQIFMGLEHIHAHKVVHRDIKSANILITDSCAVKVGDFGVGAQISATMPERGTFMGTPYWMAPEIITQNMYGPAVDVWSTGIVGIELITGKVPHSNLEPTRAMMKIADGPPPKLGRWVKGQNTLISSAYVRSVGQCLEKDPILRPTAQELSTTRWNDRLYAPASFKSLTRSLANSATAQVEGCHGVLIRPTMSDHANKADANKGWQFESTRPAVSSPPLAHRPLSPVDLNRINSPGVQGLKQPTRYSTWYLTYVDPAFNQVERRSKKAEAKTKIERLHCAFAKLDLEFPGFSQALTEEFVARTTKYPCS